MRLASMLQDLRSTTYKGSQGSIHIKYSILKEFDIV